MFVNYELIILCISLILLNNILNLIIITKSESIDSNSKKFYPIPSIIIWKSIKAKNKIKGWKSITLRLFVEINLIILTIVWFIIWLIYQFIWLILQIFKYLNAALELDNDKYTKKISKLDSEVKNHFKEFRYSEEIDDYLNNPEAISENDRDVYR